MVIIRTSAVDVSIQAVSPESSLGFSSAAQAAIGRAIIGREGAPAAPRPVAKSRNLRIIGTSSSLCFGCWASQRFDAGFTGANADRLVDAVDEDLAVADLSRAGRLGDRLDRAIDEGVVDDDLDLHLGQEAHGVLRTAIDLGLALLAAKALHFTDRQALDAERGQRVAHVVQLEWLEDRHDHFHLISPLGTEAAWNGLPSRSKQRANPLNSV